MNRKREVLFILDPNGEKIVQIQLLTMSDIDAILELMRAAVLRGGHDWLAEYVRGALPASLVVEVVGSLVRTRRRLSHESTSQPGQWQWSSSRDPPAQVVSMVARSYGGRNSVLRPGPVAVGVFSAAKPAEVGLRPSASVKVIPPASGKENHSACKCLHVWGGLWSPPEQPGVRDTPAAGAAQRSRRSGGTRPVIDKLHEQWHLAA